METIGFLVAEVARLAVWAGVEEVEVEFVLRLDRWGVGTLSFLGSHGRPWLTIWKDE